MKRLKSIAMTAALCAGGCLNGAAQVRPAIPADPEIEAKIQAWLGKMTLNGTDS